MNCPQCNQSLPDGSKFCANCGSKIAPAQEAQPAQQSATQQPAPPQWQSSPPPDPGKQPGQTTVPGNPPPPHSSSGYVPPNIYQATSQRNWLERLMDKIPGYKGYQDKETRRDVDKRHREHLATMLFQLKAPINSVVRELSDNRRLFETGPIERVQQKLDKVENRIRYASYGYSGFFDTVKIQEAQLDQLYQFDVALLNDVEIIRSKVDQLTSQVSDANALKAAAKELERVIDDLDNKFNQRFQAIENPAWFPS
jgi:hypothetical protein